MSPILSLICLLAAFVGAATAETCVAADNCEFYKCLERKYGCGSAGYPVSYGTKFCEVFKANHNSLDSDGQKWATSTRLCLQRALTSIANAQIKMTCEALRKYAFDSHPACYTQPGSSICNIGPVQTAKVMNMVGIQWTQEFWTQFASVAKKCSSSWYSGLKQAVSTYAGKLASYF